MSRLMSLDSISYGDKVASVDADLRWVLPEIWQIFYSILFSAFIQLIGPNSEFQTNSRELTDISKGQRLWTCTLKWGQCRGFFVRKSMCYLGSKALWYNDIPSLWMHCDGSRLVQPLWDHHRAVHAIQPSNFNEVKAMVCPVEIPFTEKINKSKSWSWSWSLWWRSPQKKHFTTIMSTLCRV